MGCHEVKRVIYFFLDGALSKQKYRDILEHLRLCPDCDERKRIQERLRSFVRRKIGHIPATDRFKQRLTRSLRAVSSAI